MSLRKTLALALLLVAMLLYILKVELPSSAKKDTELQPFAEVAKETIRSITVNSDGQLVYSLQNTGAVPQQEIKGKELAVSPTFWKKWTIQNTPGTQVDRGNLNTLISALAAFKLDSPLSKEDIGNDLSVFGLATPELSIQVELPERTVEVQFGKENAYVQKRYVRMAESGEVYLLSPGLFSAANKKEMEFRNKNPIEFIDGDLKELSIIDADGVRTRFQSGADFVWKIVEPQPLAASSEVLSAIGRALRGLHVTEFLDSSDLARFGLDKPQARVQLVFREGIEAEPLEITLATSKDASSTYAKVSGLSHVFKVAQNPIPELVRPLQEYREKKLFTFAVDQVVQVDFAPYQADAVTLMRQPGKWLVNGKEADGAFVAQILKDLASLEAASFPNDNRDYGFSNPRLKIIVRLKPIASEEAVEEKVLLVGDSAGGTGSGGTQYYTVVDGRRNEPFIISKESFKAIFPRLDVLTKAEAAEEAPKPQAE